MKAKSSFRINRIHPVTNGEFNLLFVLLACARGWAALTLYRLQEEEL